MDHNISNSDVLQLIFQDQWQLAHVTSFPDDPGSIPQARKGICWAGDNYYRQRLIPGENQFFCVSLFTHDPERSKRRKSTFQATYVIGLDDVMEKLPPEQVARLPVPTYKQKTSMNSEQWFYVLQVPETDRKRVDNLMDQLIENGLAPDGNDPGMKGVTRYLRLPEGSNTKAKRIKENFGMPYKCKVTEWNPHLKYTMEQLAQPFDVNLDAERPDDKVGAAAEVEDHPLLSRLHIKEVLSPGRYDITCPWVHEHTGQEDTGTAIFTNHDGTAGFQCHHGHCQGRSVRDVLDYLNMKEPGFKAQYYSWQTMYVFKNVPGSGQPQQAMPAADVQQNVQRFDFMTSPKIDANERREEQPPKLVDYQKMMDDLRRSEPNSDERLQLCNNFLQVIDPLNYAEKLRWYDQIQQIMGWNKSDLNKCIEGFRKEWYQEKALEIFNDIYFVGAMNQFYHVKKKIFYGPEAFRNSYIHLDDEIFKRMVKDKVRNKVDATDYAPGLPRLFEEKNTTFLNMFDDSFDYGRAGDAFNWLRHWDQLGWSDYRDTHLKFMAYTLRHPERKINWACVFGGREGTGKDFLLYPLRMALGDHSGSAEGWELESDFNEYLMNVKHIHFNEIELGDHAHSKAISNKLKPVIARPPETLNINIKGVRRLAVRNIVNVTIATNNYQFLHVDSNSRRYFMTWTDLNIRDVNNDVIPEWANYWAEMWHWMLDEKEGGLGGWRACAYHLTHQVDLRGFNAQAAPQVTDYMRQVQAMSRSPLENDLREYIAHRVGPFSHDIVTVDEAVSGLKVHSRNVNGVLSPMLVKRILQQCGANITMSMQLSDGVERDVCILRDTVSYQHLSKTELGQAYEKQHSGNDNATVVRLR